MEYLKVKDDTYMLKRKDMYRYDTCQWCGSTDWNMRFYHSQKIYQSHRDTQLQHLLAKRTCSECGKTTALVKSNID